MEFAPLVIHFHSTDGVSCHDSSTIEFCSSVLSLRCRGHCKDPAVLRHLQIADLLQLARSKIFPAETPEKNLPTGCTLYPAQSAQVPHETEAAKCSNATSKRNSHTLTPSHQLLLSAFPVRPCGQSTVPHSQPFATQLSRTQNSRPACGLETVR